MSLLQCLIQRLRFGKRPKSPKSSRQERGDKGETLAVEYLALTRPDLHLLYRNWKKGRHEIDAIYKENTTLVFVEVRARNHTSKISGYYSLTRSKKQSMKKAAYAFMQLLPQRPRTYRYDVVEVGMDGDQARFIRHFSNIRIF
jgi:putative endonuclease